MTLGFTPLPAFTLSQRGIDAAKSETRNPKSETNSNDQNSNDLNKLEKELYEDLNKISRN
jgi:hypothetical protein